VSFLAAGETIYFLIRANPFLCASKIPLLK
jgi:hypothetical protein